MPNNILIDGNNFAIRILLSLPCYNSQFQSDHQANLFVHSFLSGFLTTLKRIQQKYSIDNVNIIWDSKINNRKIVYPEYKANRKPKTLEEEKDKTNHYSLLDRLRFSLKPLGAWADITLEGYEADDLIAYYIRNSDHSNNFIIISSDNDLYQLLGLRCVMYLLNKKEFFTHIDFKNEFDIEPKSYPFVKALAGDTSDNIKGVYGIGIKKGIKLINEGHCWSHWVNKYHKEVDLETNLELIRLPFEESKIEIDMPQSFFDKSAWVAFFQEYTLNKLNLADFKQLLNNENKLI